MLTAVVTPAGGSYTVHLVNQTPGRPVPATTTTDGSTDTTEVVAETGATGGTESDEHHEGTKQTADGVVAVDGVAHASVETAAPGPNPIVPEIKEVAWGAGAFIVFAVIMRYVAFPRLKKGMDARYSGIRSAHDSAEATRLAAKSDVAQYQAQLASARADAAATLDAARQQLEAKRTERIAAANAEIAELRATAAAENESARAAVQSQIQGAVADVSASAITLAIGKTPDTAVVSRVVDEVMSAGVSR